MEQGVWRLAVEPTIAAWRALAKHLHLWPPDGSLSLASVPGLYRGVLRLRFRQGSLFLCLENAPLLREAQLRVSRVFWPDEIPQTPPSLLASTAAVTIGAPGASCDEACTALPVLGSARSWQCHNEDLMFLNGCDALRNNGAGCGDCQLTNGPAMPSLTVAGEGPVAPPKGVCLISANLASLRCDSAHPWVARACTCRASTAEPSSSGDDVHAAAEVPKMWWKKLRPVDMVDSSIPPSRCGAAVGNLLSADCVRNAQWCCSPTFRCGSTALDCGSQCGHAHGSPDMFCGGGWTLRLPEFGRRPLADR